MYAQYCVVFPMNTQNRKTETEINNEFGKAAWYSVEKNGEALKWYREQLREQQPHPTPAPNPGAPRGAIAI
jgi:hypothetical protein